MDLFLWYDDDKNLIQFQICYDKGLDEHVLTWHQELGLAHHSVDDDKNRSFRVKGTPIMVSGTDFDANIIALQFEKLADNVDDKTVKFI